MSWVFAGGGLWRVLTATGGQIFNLFKWQARRAALPIGQIGGKIKGGFVSLL